MTVPGSWSPQGVRVLPVSPSVDRHAPRSGDPRPPLIQDPPKSDAACEALAFTLTTHCQASGGNHGIILNRFGGFLVTRNRALKFTREHVYLVTIPLS